MQICAMSRKGQRTAIQTVINEPGAGGKAIGCSNLLINNQVQMNYPAAELRGIKMNFYLFNPDAEHRGILLIK